MKSGLSVIIEGNFVEFSATWIGGIILTLFFLTMYVRNALEHYGITTDLF